MARCRSITDLRECVTQPSRPTGLTAIARGSVATANRRDHRSRAGVDDGDAGRAIAGHVDEGAARVDGNAEGLGANGDRCHGRSSSDSGMMVFLSPQDGERMVLRTRTSGSATQGRFSSTSTARYSSPLLCAVST